MIKRASLNNKLKDYYKKVQISTNKIAQYNNKTCYYNKTYVKYNKNLRNMSKISLAFNNKKENPKNSTNNRSTNRIKNNQQFSNSLK